MKRSLLLLQEMVRVSIAACGFSPMASGSDDHFLNPPDIQCPSGDNTPHRLHSKDFGSTTILP